MTRRKLSDEEVENIASKEWKQTAIFTSDEKLANRAKNLTGPKTVEGKKKSLQNLEVGRNKDVITNFKHGGYIHKILNEEEQELYNYRREEYMKDYGNDINGSADEFLLHQVLMEEVKYYRLVKIDAEKPSADVERALNDCTRRLRTALEDLGALRKQRLKQDDKLAGVNIATIAQNFYKAMTQGDVQKQLDDMRQEEVEFLANKQNRELALEIVYEDDDVDGNNE
jgi:hypothetical protein